MKKNALNLLKRYICLLLLTVNNFFFCNGQVCYSGRPLFNPSTDSLSVPEVLIETGDIAKFDIEKKKSPFKDDVFAIPVSVDINPEEYGVWYAFPKQNKKVWLLALNAPNAQSINLILSPFNLLPGSKLFFYDSAQTQILGAITFLNNKPSDILPLSIISTDKVYCELQMPIYSDDYGYFTISQIGIEPNSENQLKSTQDQYFGRAQDCNINVNCNQNSLVQTQKNAVCRIVFLGTRRCSGTIINNIENDGTPYVLTAAHCINTEYLANTAVFYFNYESPTCENIDGPDHSVSGASLVSAGYHDYYQSDTLDFALLKLAENPPIDYFPYYSGWDASGVVPDSTFSIHHPQGDIKKISSDSDFPLTSTLDLGFDQNTHWFINDYEYGTSEDGSSGSGLIDENGHLIGTLSAGGQACSEAIGDFYQKFAHSFNDYSNEKYQLKKWLDPHNSGKLICNGYYAPGTLRDSAQLLTNISKTDVLLKLKNTVDWGYISGHNYQNNTLFVEHIKIKGSKYLYGANIVPAISYHNSLLQNIEFFIRNGGEVPGKIIYNKQIPLNLIDPGYIFKIDFDSTILVSNDFYFGYKIEYNTDTFAVKTVNADVDENTAFTYLGGKWRPLQLNGSENSSHLAVEILAFDLMPDKDVVIDTSTWNDITIYPNPATDQIQIFVKSMDNREINITLVDICGKIVLSEYYTNFGPNIPVLLNVEKGIYLLKVKLNSDNPQTFKVLVE
jgi:lysyl endopeptidase